MDGGLQHIADLKESIGPRSTIPAGGPETAGVDDQPVSDPVADSLMGMAVDHAVDFRKQAPECGFNVMAQSGTVGESNAEFTYLKTEHGRQPTVGIGITHIAVHGIHGSIMKRIQQGNVGKITGMDNGIASGETVLYKFVEILVQSHQMGV